MPYRILEYEIEIMKSAIDIRKVKNKEYKLPLVIPIVLFLLLDLLVILLPLFCLILS